MNQEESSVDSQSSNSVHILFETAEPIPRLRIHHFMLWMLCSAPLLTVLKGLMSLGGMPEEFNTFSEVAHLFYGILGGALFAGAIVLLHGWLRYGRPLLRQPGHWILLIQSITIFVGILISSWTRLVTDDSSLSMVYFCIMQLIPVLGYFIASRRATVPRWRFLFVGFCLNALLQAAHYLSLVVGAHVSSYLNWYSIGVILVEFFGLILAIWLVCAAMIDRRLRLQRDWLHWTGVFGSLALFALGFTWQITVMLMQYM